MPGYRILPHTADIGLRVSGRTWRELYKNAARGLLAIYGLHGARGPLSFRTAIFLEEATPEDLLVAWLNELIYHVSTGRWIPIRCDLKLASSIQVKGTLSGPRLGERRPKTEVKAATYHGLEVKRRGGRWTAGLILDV